eukprot:TRINITY_DN1149_c0_g1_i1.p1 TRINITY_DN1149_c0_g1~~TRINITY_DN1149_c0_g1_i1.p1  ORF type:complete len:420 (-),score=21.79 TRINITY_DN1149_c0_g1_i1:1735-2817(-)
MKSYLVECEPGQAVFAYDDQQNSLRARIGLKNVSGGSIGFKLKSTNPQRYDVQPDSVGTIPPSSTQQVWLFMKVEYGQTINTYKDKILVQAIELKDPSQKAESNMFSRTLHPEMQDTQLNVSIQKPSSLGASIFGESHVVNIPQESSQESSKVTQQMSDISGGVFGNVMEQEEYVMVDEEDSNALQVSPHELQLNMRGGRGSARAVLSLYNESKFKIAFKVKSTNAQRYLIHPGPTGIVKQHSTYDLVISISGEAIFPEEVKFIPEEIIVQSFVLVGTTRFSPTMFKHPENCPGFKQQIVPFSINIQEDWMENAKQQQTLQQRAKFRKRLIIFISVTFTMLIIIAVVIVVVLYLLGKIDL